jgi:hypothetical protein
MGLDMYLNKRIYVGANYQHNEVTGKIELFRHGEPIKINLNKVTYVVENVGYWRKANAIHRWFVDHVMDGEDECYEHYVRDEQLKELLDLCKKVRKNHRLAAELLPTQNDLFFGSTDYDEWYWQDIDLTIKILEDALKDDNPYAEYYYYPSS